MSDHCKRVWVACPSAGGRIQILLCCFKDSICYSFLVITTTFLWLLKMSDASRFVIKSERFPNIWNAYDWPQSHLPVCGFSSRVAFTVLGKELGALWSAASVKWNKRLKICNYRCNCLSFDVVLQKMRKTANSVHDFRFCKENVQLSFPPSTIKLIEANS